VVDASVIRAFFIPAATSTNTSCIPAVTSTNPATPTIMFGEQGAVMIQEPRGAAGGLKVIGLVSPRECEILRVEMGASYDP
jgi:choline dehydrogenase-like flavoprotein